MQCQEVSFHGVGLLSSFNNVEMNSLLFEFCNDQNSVLSNAMMVPVLW